jgi:hypothetical protein
VQYLDFLLWLRALHICSLPFVTLLIRSGLEILSAHPKLYWNDHCLPGSGWLNFGPRIPSGRSLALAMPTGAANPAVYWILSLLVACPQGRLAARLSDECSTRITWRRKSGHQEMAVWHHLAASECPRFLSQFGAESSKLRLFICGLWSSPATQYHGRHSGSPDWPPGRNRSNVNPGREFPRINALTMKGREELFPE